MMKSNNGFKFKLNKPQCELFSEIEDEAESRKISVRNMIKIILIQPERSKREDSIRKPKSIDLNCVCNKERFCDLCLQFLNDILRYEELC